MLRPFRVLQPTTVPEAAGEFARLGEDARVYAGGTELLVLLRHGLVRADNLVDVKRIKRLNEIEWDGEALRVGAAVTHYRLETDPMVRQHLPMLARVESQVANIRVRVQGTLGGNLCFADPYSDPGTALLVHEAVVTLGSKDGERQLPLSDFFVAAYETALSPEELLTEVKVPALPPKWGHAYLRLERFYRPTLNVAAAVKAEDGRLEGVRMAVGCVGWKALRLCELEKKLQGLTLGEAEKVVSEAKRHLLEHLRLMGDSMGSAEYKLHVVGVLLKSALREAARKTGTNHECC